MGSNEFFKRKEKHTPRVEEGMILLVGLPQKPRVIGSNGIFWKKDMITSKVEEDIVKLPKRPTVDRHKISKKVEDFPSFEEVNVKTCGTT